MDKAIKLKDGITLHFLNTKKFKTSVIAVFLTTELNRESITKEALIPAVLRLGTNSIRTQQNLNKTLEEMYGASFNCGIEKRGDNHVLKFYLEAINDEFTFEKEDLLNKSIKFILDIILDPLTKENGFNSEFVAGEKQNLKNIIQGRIDNKTTYAYSRCIEEMFKNKTFGLYEYGYMEDLEEINEKNLYECYKDLLQKCKIDIFISGDIPNEVKTTQMIETALNEKYPIKLQPRTARFIVDSKERMIEEIKEKVVTEKMDITQGKLVIGLSIKNNDNSNINIAANSVYNAILGGGANSKLFQNVREKASLAYTAGSGYLKTKNIIAVRCGIEIKNYDKALSIIKKQLEDIKKGDFSEKDINEAKELIIGGLNSVKDEQVGQISYELSKELSNEKVEIDDFINQIKKVSKNDIIDVSKNIMVNTIYFLKN